MKKILLCQVLLIILACLTALHAQNDYFITVIQPLSLVADAGHDTSIIVGEGVQLGGIPSAQYGYGGYLYLWEPSTGLDDPFVANPVATPDATTTYLLYITDIHGCTAQSSVTVTALVGINIISQLQDILIYPNPSNDFITVEFNNFAGVIGLEIYNCLGRYVFKEQIIVDPPLKKIIELSSFGKGVLIVRLQCNDFSIRRMIVNQ